MQRRTNRREFLRQTSLAGAGFWAAGGLALAQSKSANERINIACIGVGGKGSGDTDQAALVGNLVALCDIDDNRLAPKAKKYPQARVYNDFRKLFDEMGTPRECSIINRATAHLQDTKQQRGPSTLPMNHASSGRGFANDSFVRPLRGSAGAPDMGTTPAVHPIVRPGGSKPGTGIL